MKSINCSSLTCITLCLCAEPLPCFSDTPVSRTSFATTVVQILASNALAITCILMMKAYQ